VKFTNCGFWGYGKTDNHITVRRSGHVTFNNCHFAWWGQVNRQSPSIIATIRERYCERLRVSR